MEYVVRILLLLTLILSAQQTPWPGSPDLQSLVPITAVLAVIAALLARIPMFTRDMIPMPLLGLCILGAAGAILSPAPWIAIPAFGEKLAWIVATLLLIRIFTPRPARILLYIAVAVLSVEQFLLASHQFAMLRTEVWGSLGTPNALARFVIMTWPLFIAVGSFENRQYLRTISFILGVGIVGAGVLTLSRMAYLALAIQAVYLAKRLGIRRSLVGVLVILIMISGMILSGSAGSMFRNDDMTRLKAWDTALELSLRNPLMGTGIGTFSLYYNLLRPYDTGTSLVTPHSLILHLACELGLLSIPMLLWLAIWGWRSLTALESRTADMIDRAYLLAAKATILGMAVQSLVEY